MSRKSAFDDISTTSPLLAPGTQLGSFVVEELLGGGGMAKVYRVRHKVLGGLYAVKVLDPALMADEELRQRFLDEGRIQAQLLHPHIVQVRDIVIEPGIAGLIMDFVDGETLEQLIARRETPPTAEEIRDVFGPVLAAVGHAHAHGTIHRDLKPGNILLGQSSDGGVHPFVMDFGIAKLQADSPGQKRATRADARMGTLAYMSPEQVRRAADVTRRSDLYSLGAALYEFATLQPPVDDTVEFDAMQAIVQGRITPAEAVYPEIDPVIADCIHRAMQPDPAQRFASCAEFAEALLVPSATRHRAARPSSVPPHRPPITAPSTAGRGEGQSESGPPSPAPSGPALASLGGLPGWFWGVAAAGLLGVAAYGVDGLTLGDKPRCPEGMVYIAEGSFMMGSETGDPDERPQHSVTVPAFCLDKTEAAGADGLPVHGVNWYEARTACERRGARLPTEMEWEFAARGPQGRTYPWGETAPSKDRVNFCDLPVWSLQECLAIGRTVPVDALPGGATPEGVLGLAGNVWEWVEDCHIYDYMQGRHSMPGEPVGACPRRVMRGGAFAYDATVMRASNRNHDKPEVGNVLRGYRCAASPPP